MSEPQVRIDQQEARQGKGGVRLRIILGCVLAAAVVVGALLYFFVY